MKKFKVTLIAWNTYRRMMIENVATLEEAKRVAREVAGEIDVHWDITCEEIEDDAPTSS